jgi:hypothetical protein
MRPCRSSVVATMQTLPNTGLPAGGQQVDVVHAVQHRKDRDTRSDGRLEIVEGLVEGVGLHREDYEMERPGNFTSRKKPRRKREVAV